MLTVSQLVSELRAAEGAGFDVSAIQATLVVDRWIKRLAAVSKWIREERELGPAVAGVDVYEIDNDIVDIHEMVVGGEPAQRVSVTDIFRLKSGQSWLRNGPPWVVFCPKFDSVGTKMVQVYPAPEVGTSLLGLCSVMPAGTLANDYVPPFPDDYEETILNGAKSTLYRELDENPDEGDYYEQKFMADAETLRRRANSRVGSGPFRIPSYRDVVR